MTGKKYYQRKKRGEQQWETNPTGKRRRDVEAVNSRLWHPQ